MKIYNLVRKQTLAVTVDQAWEFFSSPANLKKITPAYMGFEITSNTGDGVMYAGQIITYKVTPVLGIPLNWATEITHVSDKKYFVDEQRFGPYAFWHHQHWFKEVEGGVEMTDIIHYALPMGILGRWANSLFVKAKLEEIFDHRKKMADSLFL